tara:strand:- start:180 stop:641 length:462 start_codon:yes stop_codon:yes gene_type:complete
MTKEELIAKIKSIAPKALAAVNKAEVSAVEYEELTAFPALKDVIVDLLTSDYGKFIDRIDWVAPKPTTFRVVFLNDEFIYLIYHTRSWIAEISGKKYYLLNLPEMENATKAISRLLRNGSKVDDTGGVDTNGAEDSTDTEVDVEVNGEENIEV